MDLDALKYADLRQLAKSVGLKANMKAEKLLKALKTHFEQEDSENGNNVATGESQPPAQRAEEPHQTSASYVTKRQNAKRGRNQNAKRKSNDRGSDARPKVHEKPALDNAKSAGEENGRRSTKRRKVSSAKNVEIPPASEELEVRKPETKPPSINTDAALPQSAKGVSKKVGGKIPRHEGLMKKKTALKTTTPNFKKLHEAHFSKMESIDSYMQRRNKQLEELKSSIKELKQPHDVPFSPGVQEGRRAPARTSVFRPGVLSANKINVRFSQATRDNEHKRSLVKTPARAPPLAPPTTTPRRTSEAATRTETNAATGNKTPRLTAFVFSGTTSTPATNKKNFDLKASLSRPLTYKPHKGKLKPFGAVQENQALDKPLPVSSHQKNYKQHQVQTREERRAKRTEDRKQKKEKMLGARRGLVLT